MEIITIGDRILTKKAKRIAKIDDSVRNVCASMVKTMVENNGCGLSGNQVGILKRIIVILHDNEPKVMINPEIVEHSDDTECLEEGCLSIPGEFIQKERYKNLMVRYRNTKGNLCYEQYSGQSAKIIQHEIDHLDGILMID